MSNAPFSDPDAVARYAEGPKRLVPGFEALQRMARILVAERAPHDARVLVVGAGGGLELREFATAQPGWTFDGVDPSGEMLALAKKTLGPLVDRAALHEGFVDVAPEGPFDGATCLLTFHFVTREERTRIAAEVRRRLRPGARFVVAHFSLPSDPGARKTWLARYAEFAIDSGVERAAAEKARDAIADKLHILDPSDDEKALRDAGFTDVAQFFQGFTFRGWVASA